MRKSFISKVVNFALIGAMMVSMTACSSTKSSTSAKGTTSAAATATPNSNTYTPVDYSKMDPLKVSAMLISWGSNPAADNNIEKEFEKRTNSQLDITWVPYQEYVNRFNLLIASGDVKDVMQTMAVNGDIFYPQVVQAVKGGLFQPLDSIIKDTDYVKKNAIMSTWSEDIWKYCSFNKKIYALPRQALPAASNSGIIVRKDLMDKAGLKEPTTLDELNDLIIKLNKPGEYYGLQFSKDDFDATEVKAIAVAYTGVQDWGVDKDGNFTFQSFMPEYKDFLKWMKKLYDAKAIDPEFALNQYANSDFLKGKSALKMHVWWNFDQSADGKTKKFFDKSVSDEARVWAFMPIKGPKAYTTGRTAGFENPIMISSKFDKKNLPRLFDMINRTDDDFQFFVKNGMEGLHYSLKDGKPVRSDEQNKQRSADNAGGWYMMFMIAQDLVQEKFVNSNASPENVQRAKDIRDASDKYMKEYNIALPQLTLDAPTYNSKWNTVVKDLKDNRVKVVMGKMSLDEWDKYVKDVTSSDTYQSIIKEFKQAYLANK